MTAPNTNPSDLDLEALGKAREAYCWLLTGRPDPSRLADAIRAYLDHLPPASGVPEVEEVAWRERIKVFDKAARFWGKVGERDEYFAAKTDYLVALKALLAAPPPVVSPSGEVVEEAFRAGWVAKSTHWNVHEALGSYLASSPSPIASEPKDAGSGEGQLSRQEQTRALGKVLDLCTVKPGLQAYVVSLINDLHAAGYRIARTAPSGAKP